jgi:hypothetical protein
VLQDAARPDQRRVDLGTSQLRSALDLSNKRHAGQSQTVISEASSARYAIADSISSAKGESVQ